MMCLKPTFVMFVLMLSLSAQAQLWPTSVDVFYVAGSEVSGGSLTHQMQQQKVPLSVFDLSQARKLNRSLSDGLPRDPEQAKRHIQSLLAKNKQAPMIYAQAMIGQERARRYDLKYLPAIVFNNGQSVIYGIQDMDYAIELYRQAQ